MKIAFQNPSKGPLITVSFDDDAAAATRALSFVGTGRVVAAANNGLATLRAAAQFAEAAPGAAGGGAGVAGTMGPLALIGMFFAAGDSPAPSHTPDPAPHPTPSPDQLRCMADPYNTSAECAAVRSALATHPIADTHTQNPNAARASASTPGDQVVALSLPQPPTAATALQEAQDLAAWLTLLDLITAIVETKYSHFTFTDHSEVRNQFEADIAALKIPGISKEKLRTLGDRLFFSRHFPGTHREFESAFNDIAKLKPPMRILFALAILSTWIIYPAHFLAFAGALRILNRADPSAASDAIAKANQHRERVVDHAILEVLSQHPDIHRDSEAFEVEAFKLLSRIEAAIAVPILMKIIFDYEVGGSHIYSEYIVDGAWSILAKRFPEHTLKELQSLADDTSSTNYAERIVAFYLLSELRKPPKNRLKVPVYDVLEHLRTFAIDLPNLRYQWGGYQDKVADWETWAPHRKDPGPKPVWDLDTNPTYANLMESIDWLRGNVPPLREMLERFSTSQPHLSEE